MDSEYESQFPDEIVRVRTEVGSERNRLLEEANKLDKIEELYTEFDNYGTVYTEPKSFPHPRDEHPTFKFRMVAHITSLEHPPVGELLQMGGTATFEDDGEMALYKVENTFTIEV